MDNSNSLGYCVIGSLFTFAFTSIAYFWNNQGLPGLAVFFFILSAASTYLCINGVCAQELDEADDDETSSTTNALLCEPLTN